MVIKASAAGEIRLLVQSLSNADGTAREAAAARLAVIGDRAVPHLLAAYGHADAPARVSMLRVLARLTDARAMSLALDALAGDEDLAIAATQVLRGLLDARDPDVAGHAFGALLTTAVDTNLPTPVRHRALDSLGDMPAAVRDRLREALAAEPDASLRAAAAALGRGTGSPGRTASAGPSGQEIWDAALAGALPGSPGAMAGLVSARAATAPLTALQKLVDAIRQRETASDPGAPEWLALRGAVHEALARRGSRVALYDLRESLSTAAGPAPVSFLAALHEVGDNSCLEPLARAFTAAGADEEWWRQQIAAAFRAIMSREKLTKRSAAVKRLAARWPAAVAAATAFSTPSRTTPRRSTGSRT